MKNKFSQSINKIAEANIRTGLQEMAAETLADLKKDLIQQFHQTTASFFDLIERHRAQNQELTTLRDWLLPMLMNGQVRVTG